MSYDREIEMRILLIRHGDPDYMHDALTEKGKREAALLAKMAPAMDLGECFVSPMGRAQETASYSLKATHKTAKTVNWLMEFITDLNLNEHPDLREAYGTDTPLMKDIDPQKLVGKEYLSYTNLLHPELLRAFLPKADGTVPKYAPRIVWDMLPSYYGKHPELSDPKEWRNSEIANAGCMNEAYDYVTGNFDRMLAEHGYEREGGLYHVKKSNHNTVTCFCHLGVICVLLSHLWNLSPFQLWMNLGLAPTSVTELVTEERQEGTAIFRGLRVGDQSHLRAAGEEPSFMARFCEEYSNMEQRH